MFREGLRHIRTILETPNGSRTRFRSRQAPKPNTQIGRSPDRGLTVGHVANSIQAACWASIFSAIPWSTFQPCRSCGPPREAGCRSLHRRRTAGAAGFLILIQCSDRRPIDRHPVQRHDLSPAHLDSEAAAHQTDPSLCSICSIMNARRSAIDASAMSPPLTAASTSRATRCQMRVSRRSFGTWAISACTSASVRSVIFKSGMMIGCGRRRDQFLPAMCQCGLRASAMASVIPVLAGGSSMPPQGLQNSQGMPAPQPHASARLLSPCQGRFGWFSHTQPVVSQFKRAMGYK
jgi:hypothetical protein